jgi:hypothetical protein
VTPQALLKLRFSELAESLKVDLRVRRQRDKFYFLVVGDWRPTERFIQQSFPDAWMTSGAGPECTYGLPLPEVERVLAGLRVDPAWLAHNDAVARRLAEAIRAEGRYAHLPILADALEEGGCDNAEILAHCRENARHRTTCWVVELLLGPERRRKPGPPSEDA